MDSDVLDRIPPARELRDELGRALRRVDALKQLIKVAEKRGDDDERTGQGGRRA